MIFIIHDLKLLKLYNNLEILKIPFVAVLEGFVALWSSLRDSSNSQPPYRRLMICLPWDLLGIYLLAWALLHSSGGDSLLVLPSSVPSEHQGRWEDDFPP